jgi:homoserine O-acetyltransferase
MDQRFGLDRKVTLAGPLALDGGGMLAPVEIAYETYGTLSADAGNAILVCHALTGDQHLASAHPRTGKPGWWARMVGPGKPIDTNRWFVICSNVIGSCLGSSGPASIDPATGVAYAMRFPVITIRDMVRAQGLLLDHLGVETLAAVVGGSMGGMQALSWAATFPQRARAAVVIAASARHSAQNIAFHEVGRQAIMADPNWRGGDYYGHARPAAGLATARMVGHMTYLSDERLQWRFGRTSQTIAPPGTTLEPEFAVESYLAYQGNSFVERFDANSYLYITKALDVFDASAGYPSLVAAFKRAQASFLVASFSSDWLYPPSDSATLAMALQAAGRDVFHHAVDSALGHDAFLLEHERLTPLLVEALMSI